MCTQTVFTLFKRVNLNPIQCEDPFVTLYYNVRNTLQSVTNTFDEITQVKKPQWAPLYIVTRSIYANRSRLFAWADNVQFRLNWCLAAPPGGFDDDAVDDGDDVGDGWWWWCYRWRWIPWQGTASVTRCAAAHWHKLVMAAMLLRNLVVVIIIMMMTMIPGPLYLMGESSTKFLE